MSFVKQHILPVFLPMQGCPQHCMYCDQRVIASREAPPTPELVAAQLAEFEPDADAEIAFYSGSFTCLPEALQDAYLAVAAAAVRAGKLGGIRLSTRPDAVFAATCARLRAAGVTMVELGVQSFSAAVLAASQRGYDADQAAQACRNVRAGGLKLGVQLMTGLPADSPADSLHSLRTALELGADCLRIYPTLVLRHTALADAYEQGSYQPQSLAEAVSLAASMLTLAKAADVPVIRIGLHPSESLEQSLLAGPYHPALGGLVKEELRRRVVAWALADYDPAEAGVLRFCKNELPLMFGQNRAQLLALAEHYPALALKPEAAFAPGQLELCTAAGGQTFWELEYCRSAAAGR